MININDRLNEAVKTKEPTNCIGTALFLVGEREEDRIVSTYGEVRDSLTNLKIIDSPERGCIITWERYSMDGDEVVHMGVITDENPLKVTSRIGGYHIGMKNQPIFKDFNFEDVDEYFGEEEFNRYYKPQQEISFEGY